MKKCLFTNLLLILINSFAIGQDPFVTTWETTYNNQNLTIPTTGSGYNYTVDWGDGTVTTGHIGNANHTFATIGYHTITISDTFPRIYFNNSGNKSNIISIDQWGDGTWTSMESAFSGCSNLISTPLDTPDFSNVTSMGSMFYQATVFNGAIGHWDVSNVTAMDGMFYRASAFNQDIGSWDVSNVTNMSFMFNTALVFNQDMGQWDVSNVNQMRNMFEYAYVFNKNIGSWDVLNVTSMEYMFHNAWVFDQDIGYWEVDSVTNMMSMFDGAFDFNQDIGDWNVSNVTLMSNMFHNAQNFNQYIGDWDVSNVSYMTGMFYYASAFNQNIGPWDVGKVTDMYQMFRQASAFNQNIGQWDVSKITNMRNMFTWAINFNQDIGDWNVSNVLDMSSMFTRATSFNQPIGNWDVSRIKNMESMFNYARSFNQDISVWVVDSVQIMNYMFSGASSFNQDISAWNVEQVTSMNGMFANCYRFDQNLGSWNISNVTGMFGMFNRCTLSTKNYDAILIGWDSLTVQPNISFHAGQYSQYCIGDSARARLINNHGWTISDGGQSDCPRPFITTWWLDSPNDTIIIPTTGGGYNYHIDWGDGTVDTTMTSDASHIYSVGGNHRITISGLFPQIYFNNEGSKDNLISIDQWGDSKWRSMNRAFYGCSNLSGGTLDNPDLSAATDLTKMFCVATLFNQDISAWDISGIQSMDSMFHSVTLAQEHYDNLLISWNNQNVQTSVNFSGGNSTYCLGEAARDQLQTSHGWNITDGGNPECLSDFTSTWQLMADGDSITIPTTGGGYLYNVDWGDGNMTTGHAADVTHVYDTAGLYSISISGQFPRIYFNNNGDKNKIVSVDNWGANQWLSMEGGFYGCSNLIINATDAPDLSLATSMKCMFAGNQSMNQAIGHWNLFTITNMDSLFFQATSFNQDIRSWYTRNVTTMNSTFSGATAFNQNIGSWNTRHVVDMSNMFSNANSFDQYLGNWNIRNVSDMQDMFLNVTLSQQNYDALLIKWDEQVLQNGVIFSGGNSQYCGGADARDSMMINDGWIITDGGLNACGQDFITTWRTLVPNDTITIPILPAYYDQGPGFNYTVNWGDGQVTSDHTQDATHVYLNPGDFTISISGSFPGIYFFDEGDKDKIISIDQWGTTLWANFIWAFAGCSNLAGQAIDAPNLAMVNSTQGMFWFASSFNQDMSNWNVGNVTDMRDMFGGATSFNQDIGDWDVGNVSKLQSIFAGAHDFNQDIGEWDVSNIDDMSGVFFEASSFNQDIGNWDVSNVNNYHSMFKGASSFNQDIGDWNTNRAIFMEYMFDGATSFDQNIGSWNIENVIDSRSIFNDVTLSSGNYDSILIGWEQQNLTFHNVFGEFDLGINNSKYCQGGLARQNIINNLNWKFEDGGLDFTCFPSSFITTWETTTQYESITIPTFGSGYNYQVDWGDGFINSGYTGDASHVYENNGGHQVIISGDFPRIYFNNSGDKLKIKSIDQWSNFAWPSMERAFYGCNHLEILAKDTINLSNATNLKYMFSNVYSFDHNIGHWDISTITHMDSMFHHVTIPNDHYDAILIAWNAQNLQPNVIFDGGLSAYCAAISEHNNIELQDSWTIKDAGPCRPFKMTWNITEGMQDIIIPTRNQIGNLYMEYDYEVDWGDGTVTSDHTGDAQHFYSESGVYQISISGDFPHIEFGDLYSGFEKSQRAKIISIDQWGTGKWESMYRAFYECINLTGLANDRPNLSVAKDLNTMFFGNTLFNQDIDDWDVSTVEDMQGMFARASLFNQDIGSWDVSNVTKMNGMFRESAFNQDISNWDVSNVITMNSMFRESPFNQDISDWNVSKVTTMIELFRDAISFNQPLQSWDVSNVTQMSYLFTGGTSFNHVIGDWEVGNVTDMKNMFSGATVFNQDIGNWDVKNVTDMTNMFLDATTFNQAIGNWDVGNVTDIKSMFQGATTFNQDIGGWDMSQVTSLSVMFGGAQSFNQDIGNWDISSVNSLSATFSGATSFDQNIGNWNVENVTNMTAIFNLAKLSTHNYDSLLIGWNAQNLKPNLNFFAKNSVYCVGAAARANMIASDGWTITDQGECLTPPVNDSLCQATNLILNDPPVSGTVVASYVELNEPNGSCWTLNIIPAINSVWYTFVAPENGIILVSAVSSNFDPWSFHDIHMSLHEAPIDCEDMTTLGDQIACTENGGNSVPGGWNSLMTAENLTPGQIYYVRVDGFLSATGDFEIEITNCFPPIFELAYGTNNCPTEEFFIAVDISDLGSSPFVNILDSNDSTLIDSVGIGIYNVGPFPADSLIDIVVFDISDTSCATILSFFTPTACLSPDVFVTSWQTTSPNESITIPTSGSGYNYTVDWGDGDITTNHTENAIHTYILPGQHRVTISDTFPSIRFSSSTNSNKIISIDQWGSQVWTSMNSAFYRCSNLIGNAIDTPNLSMVTDMSFMFANAHLFNLDIGNWDVSTVTNMQYMFGYAQSFNQDIGDWNVSNVTNMKQMFYYADSFNQDIGDWNVSIVSNMADMFRNAHLFNQPIGNWDVSNVTNMKQMFNNAQTFNQYIGDWDVSSVLNMSTMFSQAFSFNQHIGNWDVSKVSSIFNMFLGASAFNQDIRTWDVDSVSNFKYIFRDAIAFNQDIGDWDVSSATRMDGMFQGATSFDQNISSWDVSGATNMKGMFQGAISFNQNIGDWNVSSVYDMTNMFLDVTLSTENYDSLLIGWNALDLYGFVPFDAGNSQYCAGASARENMVNNDGWGISDQGVDPGCRYIPSCASILAPILGDTTVSVFSDLIWGADSLAAGFELNAGFTPLSIDLINALSVGGDTMYNDFIWPFDTTIYVHVKPVSPLYGSPLSCPIDSFETEAFLPCSKVYNVLDSLPGSFAYAVDCAQSGDTIIFSLGLVNDTIPGMIEPISIDKNLTIIVDTLQHLFLSGENLLSALEVSSGITVKIVGLNMIGSNVMPGNAIINLGNLTLEQVKLMPATNGINNVLLQNDGSLLIVGEVIIGN